MLSIIDIIEDTTVDGWVPELHCTAEDVFTEERDIIIIIVEYKVINPNEKGVL